MDLQWGLNPPAGVQTAWGARAIYRLEHLTRRRRIGGRLTSTEPVVSYLWDRQDGQGDPKELKRLLAWVNTRGTKRLVAELLAAYVTPASDGTVVVDDGEFHMIATPRRSHGYLYVGAWVSPHHRAALVEEREQSNRARSRSGEKRAVPRHRRQAAASADRQERAIEKTARQSTRREIRHQPLELDWQIGPGDEGWAPPSSNRAAPPSTQIVTPLAGHHDESTAYLVEDYPYGFRLRTQIRYWTEAVPKKGVRFVSQTMDPRTGRWNKPKKSTFARFAIAMYLDEHGHVQTKALSEYSKAAEFADYLSVFGLEGAIMPDVRDFAAAKVRLKEGLASGKVFWTVNKEPRPESDFEKAQHAAEAEEWRSVLARIEAIATAYPLAAG